MTPRLPVLVAWCAMSLPGCDATRPPDDPPVVIDAGLADSGVDAPSAPLVDLLAAIAADADQLAVDESHLYWLQGGAVYRVGKDLAPGASAELVIAPGVSADTLAVSAGQVYWSSRDQRAIMRAPVDGGAEELVVSWDSPGEPAQALLVDDTHVYWREALALARADKAGGARELVTTASAPIGAVTMAGDSLYFATPGAGYEVREVAKSGGPSTVAFGIVVLSAGSVLGNAAGIVLQCGKDTVDPYRSLIAGYPLPAGPGEVLAIIPDTAMAVTGDNKYAYCAADTGIHRVPRSGGAVQMLAGGEQIVDLVADGEGALFWLDQATPGLYRRVER